MNAYFMLDNTAYTVCQASVSCRLQSGSKSKPNNQIWAFGRKKRKEHELLLQTNIKGFFLFL